MTTTTLATAASAVLTAHCALLDAAGDRSTPDDPADLAAALDILTAANEVTEGIYRALGTIADRLADAPDATAADEVSQCLEAADTAASQARECVSVAHSILSRRLGTEADDIGRWL